MERKMDFSDFYHHIEETVSRCVRSCYPFSWDENHITFKICDELTSRNKEISLEGLDRPFKILWDTRKLRLPTESDYGDLAVIVRLSTWAGETLEGVGLLEAKKRDVAKSSFSAAKKIQLSRIASNAPSAQLLLYDYDNVSSCMDNWSTQFEDHFYKRRYGSVQPYTHCICVPARTALQIGRFNTDLHKFGVPLSYQLVGRYFRGFDLELKPSVISSIKGNALRHGGPRTLLLVGVSTGEQPPELPSVSNDLYGPVDGA
jgi:hypothetical protein